MWLCPTRYYGLSVWFPDVIKHLQADEYASKVKIHTNERIEDFTFNFTLENQIHSNGLFVHDRYSKSGFSKSLLCSWRAKYTTDNLDWAAFLKTAN